MEKENDIHELYLSERRNAFIKEYLEDKYIINDADTKPYYTWSSINDTQLESLSMVINFSVLSEPIIYKNFHDVGSYENLKEWSTGEREREVEETGYVVPEFRFINIQLNEKKISEDDYKKALLKLKTSDDKLLLENILQISAFKDALLKQIILQSNVISDINQRIISVFKVYHYESKLAICNSDISSEKKLKFLNATDEDSSFIIQLIGLGASSEKVTKEYIPGTKKWNRFLPEKYWESTVNGLNKYCKSRDKILETSAILAKQYLPYESLLEDIFLNREIKSFEEFSEQNDQKMVYGNHAINSDWIQKTFAEQMEKLPSKNQANIKTQKLYFEKFGLSIGKSQIYRICGYYIYD